MSTKVFLAFVIVSISSMFPNNAFMNAHEYFYYKLRNVTETTNGTSSGVTPMQSEFEAFITVFGGAACVLGNLLNVFATKLVSNTSRVVFGHFLVVAVFVPTMALTYIDFDGAQSFFFWTSLAMISIACFGSLGLIAGGVLGLSAQFPPKYTQAVMIGQSIAGVLAAALSIICQATTSNVVVNGRSYFLFCFFWTIVSVFVYMFLVNQQESEQGQTYSRLTLEDDYVEDGEDQERPPSPRDYVVGSFTEQSMMVVRQTGIDLASVSIVLIVTLAAYPALTSLVKSTSRNPTWNEYFSSLIAFLLYNVGDLIGRSSANALPISKKWLFWLTISRALLIPLIAVCNVQPRAHTPVLIPLDGVFITFVFILAFSHGFCITNATVGATRSIDENLRELAGSIISLVCVLAALIGAVVGVIALQLI